VNGLNGLQAVVSNGIGFQVPTQIGCDGMAKK
jgi:hypothetical protein